MLGKFSLLCWGRAFLQGRGSGGAPGCGAPPEGPPPADREQHHLGITQSRQEGLLRAPGRLPPCVVHRCVQGHTFTRLLGHFQRQCFKSVPLPSKREGTFSALQAPAGLLSQPRKGCWRLQSGGQRATEWGRPRTCVCTCSLAVTLQSARGLCTRPARAHAQGCWDTWRQGQEPNARLPSGHVPFQNPAQRQGRKASLDYQTSSTFLEYLQPPPPQLQACRCMEH